MRTTVTAAEPVLLTGPAATLLAARLGDLRGSDWLVDRELPAAAAPSLLELTSRGIPAAAAEVNPLYLRRSEAELGISKPPEGAPPGAAPV